MKADGSFPHYDYQYIRTCTTLPDLLRIRYPTLVHNPLSVLSRSVVTQLLKEFYAFYVKPKVHCRLHKSPPLLAVFIQIIPVHKIAL